MVNKDKEENSVLRKVLVQIAKKAGVPDIYENSPIDVIMEMVNFIPAHEATDFSYEDAFFTTQRELNEKRMINLEQAKKQQMEMEAKMYQRTAMSYSPAWQAQQSSVNGLAQQQALAQQQQCIMEEMKAMQGQAGAVIRVGPIDETMQRLNNIMVESQARQALMLKEITDREIEQKKKDQEAREKARERRRIANASDADLDRLFRTD